MKNIVLFVITVLGYLSLCLFLKDYWGYLGSFGAWEYVAIIGTLMLLCAPFNIDGNVWTVLGNAESEGSIFSFFSLYQRAKQDAVTIFGLSYQKAGRSADTGIGASVQNAGEAAGIVIGVGVYQKSTKEAGVLLGVALLQDAGDEASMLIGVAFWQNAGQTAVAVLGLAFYQSLTGVSPEGGLYDAPKSRTFGVYKKLSYS